MKAIKGTYNSLQGIEQQRQRFIHTPGDKYQDRDDEKGDLDTTTNCHAHRQIEFSFPRNYHSRRVFGRITDDRYDNQSDKLFGYIGMCGNEAFEGAD